MNNGDKNVEEAVHIAQRPLPYVYMLLLNLPHSWAVFFLVVFLIGLPACSAMTQRTDAPELIGETDGSYVDNNVDFAITARVKTEIAKEPLLKDEEIGVKTSGGTVRMTGRVSSILVMEKALEVARGVQGVKSVKDEMQFRWQY